MTTWFIDGKNGKNCNDGKTWDTAFETIDRVYWPWYKILYMKLMCLVKLKEKK